MGSETPFINANPGDQPERHAVRALLFNPQGELLLIQYRGNPDLHQMGRAPVLDPHWGTAGGGIDPGEDLHLALRREVEEEIGHKNISIGPEIWRRRAHMVMRGQPLRLDERYFIVTTPDTFIKDEARTAYERAYVLDTRWWAPADIVKTPEIILPLFLRDHIAALAAGDYPATTLLFDET